VLADHAGDIVMFGAPPPGEGVRGLDAYREAWPPFFEWQRAVAARLTLESRREGGRWVVAHEHHSFTDRSTPGAAEDPR
jgi:ketosteroid isomerase-like protein